jgi:hypothetical protein
MFLSLVVARTFGSLSLVGLAKDGATIRRKVRASHHLDDRIDAFKDIAQAHNVRPFH